MAQNCISSASQGTLGTYTLGTYIGLRSELCLMRRLGNVTCTPSTPYQAWVGRFLLKRCILLCIHSFFAFTLLFRISPICCVPVHYGSRGDPGAHVHSHDRAFGVGSSMIISISSQHTNTNKQIPVLFSRTVVSSAFGKVRILWAVMHLLADIKFQASNLKRTL